jgi:CDP-diacylglycerol--glycerol-3-phosphate 3-phosphatidyltransferase
LDGAVAVTAQRATRFGAAADAIADRVADVAFAAVLWRCGVSWPVALAAAAVAVGIDLLRRLRRVPDRITVGERPTWTVCAVLAAGSSAVTDAQWPVLACAAVWLAAGGVGLAQIGRPFHRSRPRRRSRSERSVR